MSLCVKCATVAILMFTYIPVPDQTILQERNKLYDIHDCQVLVAIDTSNHEDRNGVQSRLTVQYLEYCTDRHKVIDKQGPDLHSKEVLTLVPFQEGPLRRLALEKVSAHGHLPTSNVSTKPLADTSEREIPTLQRNIGSH